jgi:predicted nuclease of predicted toxin-antitoxin system
MIASPTSSSLAQLTPKLGKLLPLLGSDRDGEVVAAARAIDRALRSAGCDWHDLAARLSTPTSVTQISNTDWRAAVRFCTSRFGLLTEWEQNFIATLATYRERPTDKQIKLLRCISDRLRRAA